MSSRKAVFDKHGWLANAPDELKARCDKRKADHGLLDRLLRDPKMRRPWLEIDRCIKDTGRAPPRAYEELWQGIRWALSKANHHTKEARQSKNKRRLKIASEARELAEHLQTSPFDYAIGQLCPENGAVGRWAPISELLDALASSAGKKPDPWAVVEKVRLEIVSQARELAELLRDDWFDDPITKLSSETLAAATLTPISKLLGALATKADVEPAAWSVVKRDYGKYRSNLFIRTLKEDCFDYWLGGPLSGSLAAIASIALQEPLELKDVKRALAPPKRG